MLSAFILAGLHGNRRMIRTPDKKEGDSETIFRGEMVQFPQEQFVAGPVKAGECKLMSELLFLQTQREFPGEWLEQKNVVLWDSHAALSHDLLTFLCSFDIIVCQTNISLTLL